MATAVRSGERRAFGSYVLALPRVGGLVGGLLFFLVSLEPTVWPRVLVVEARSVAIMTAVGYGFGSLVGLGISRLWRLIRLPLFSEKARRRVTVGAAIVAALLALLAWQLRQIEQRDVVGIPHLSFLDAAATLAIAGILTVAFVMFGRTIGWSVYQFDGLLARWLPVWAAHVATVALMVGLIVVGSVGVYALNRDIIHGPNLTATAAELSLSASFPPASGWSATQLDEALGWADEAGATAVVVFDDGQLVAEWGDTALVSDVRSVRKSIVSVLYGIAIERGLVDQSATLAQLGIDDVPPLTDQERQATIDDIITARSGIYHASVMDDDAGGRPERGSHRPGEYFYYNNWSFNAAGGIFDELTGMTIGDAFLEWIAEPIGMEDFDEEDVLYASSPESRFPTYDFLMSTRDLARFGLLMEQEGLWEGQQIVSAAWIEESTNPHSTVRDQIGYAHMWWTDGQAYFASGTGGQRIYIDPQSGLVIAVKVNTGPVATFSHKPLGLVSGALWDFYGPDITYTDFTQLAALVNSAAPR